jgi:heptosyltransferase-2
MEWNDINRLIIQMQYWDVVLNADKSREACAFVASLDADDVRGFTLSDFGQIIPANPEAAYNFRMGIDDELKFRLNKRTGQSILAETWDLPYGGAEYILELTDEEKEFCGRMRAEWGLNGRTVAGINTGCSELFPNKKMTVDQHVKLIELLMRDKDTVILLLGGGETDRERNAEIMKRVHAPERQVISTPTNEGLRRGICYENLADVIITGDTFGMHLGIALRKHVLVWFGLSCWEEIELYERGTKYYPDGLECAPCWKRICPNNLECIDLVPVEAIAAAVLDYSNKNLRQQTGDIA